VYLLNTRDIRPYLTYIRSKSSNCQTPSLIWVVDQDQFNPYVAYEGYVVRVPHNPHLNTSGIKAGYLIIFVSVGNNLLRLLTGFAKVKI